MSVNSFAAKAKNTIYVSSRMGPDELRSLMEEAFDTTNGYADGVKRSAETYGARSYEAHVVCELDALIEWFSSQLDDGGSFVLSIAWCEPVVIVKIPHEAVLLIEALLPSLDDEEV